MVQKRYRALRVIATLNKVLGIAVGVATLVLAVAAFASILMGGAVVDSINQQLGEGTTFFGLFGGMVGGLVVSFLMLVNGLALALALYAFGEGIYVLLDMETNTRTTSMLLQKQLAAQASHTQPRQELRSPVPAIEPAPLFVVSEPVVRSPIPEPVPAFLESEPAPAMPASASITTPYIQESTPTLATSEPDEPPAKEEHAPVVVGEPVPPALASDGMEIKPDIV